MPEAEFPMPEIDRIVHEPARLAILTVLTSCERADFLFLERATGLSRGNLSVHLSRLEAADLIEIRKTIERKRTLTTAALTTQGRRTLDAYWETMGALRDAGRRPSRNTSAAKPKRLPPRSLVPAEG